MIDSLAMTVEWAAPSSTFGDGPSDAYLSAFAKIATRSLRRTLDRICRGVSLVVGEGDPYWTSIYIYWTTAISQLYDNTANYGAE